jgi:hypothetical protein
MVEGWEVSERFLLMHQLLLTTNCIFRRSTLDRKDMALFCQLSIPGTHFF